MPKSYRDLLVWKRSFILTKDTYKVLEKLPKTEQFGLISQVQRSAVSIPSNIAEGQQRSGPKEFKQFLGIARGSAAELSTQLQLIQELYEIDVTKLIEELEEIQKMLYSLQNKL
ncbi:MAG TPA: four helix bundle protein [Candidatus Saccharimonadales bacterium]|nr:four helix bundle protein [Candidatus Saccharimonadales bacterium]